MRQFQNVPLRPISASGSNFNPPNTPCIPVVKIFAFLDLEQISKDFEIEHFATASYKKCWGISKVAQKNKGNGFGVVEKPEKVEFITENTKLTEIVMTTGRAGGLHKAL